MEFMLIIVLYQTKTMQTEPQNCVLSYDCYAYYAKMAANPYLIYSRKLQDEPKRMQQIFNWKKLVFFSVNLFENLHASTYDI